MNLNDYFEIANLLVNLKEEKISKEILYRTAINRLYYGVFHLIQAKFNIFIPEEEIIEIHKGNVSESNNKSKIMK